MNFARSSKDVHGPLIDGSFDEVPFLALGWLLSSTRNDTPFSAGPEAGRLVIAAVLTSDP